MTKQLAVVTGGNRGVGLACVQRLGELGYQVILCSRDISCGNQAAERFTMQGMNVKAARLDVTDQENIDHVISKLNRVDVLINCAGVYIDADKSFLEITENDLMLSINTNAIGAWRMCKAVAPFMIESKFGRIVNVSSGWASLTEMGANAAAYRISKASLNAVTRVVSAELSIKGDIKVNSVCPGWVKTRMGGCNADLHPIEAAEDVLWPVFFDSYGYTGRFFRARKLIAW